jgi:hemolysin III
MKAPNARSAALPSRYGESVIGVISLDRRPTWRGWLHALAFVAAIPAGVLLILAADRPAARAAAAVYVGALLLLFGTSAGYHLLARSPRARAIMQRLDHSMIYVLIAGTYVPMCVVALPASWGIPLLSAVGLGAVVGVVLKLVAFRVVWIGYALYPALGWAAVAAAPALASHLTTGQLALIASGGVAYTIGFPVLLLRRPDPWPRAFGYHEVWHGCTVVAAVLHFAAVASLVS